MNVTTILILVLNKTTNDKKTFYEKEKQFWNSKKQI
jgi:hypothetical protein